MRLALLLSLLAVQVAPSAQPPRDPHRAVASAYVPQRVFDTRRKTFSDFEVMLADLSRADVVIVGEQHDDSNTHRLQAAMLQGLLRRGAHVTVSLEMFERDVQPLLIDYLRGEIDEKEFLAASRPWPRYATDYRPLVEMARAHGWPVIAANVPRQHAAGVVKMGLAHLEKLPEEERPLVAREVQCPLDRYFEQFTEAMSGHPPPGSERNSADARRQTSERYYFSQCVKDETMAESVVAAFDRQAGRPTTIVHFNGAFHSDFGTGVTERVRRRLPGRRVALVSILPVQNIDEVAPGDEDLQRAEYLVYTVK